MITNPFNTLLDGHKLWWHLDRVHEWQRGKPVTPIYLEISPTTRCSHNCVFCALDFAQETDTSIDADRLCALMGEMHQEGLKSMMYAGEGEPLMHPAIGKMVRTARDHGIDVAITTNGMNGNRDLWEEILESMTWIRFSIDAGSARVYEKVHRVPTDCFDQTLDAIRAAVNLKRDKGLATTIGVQFLVIDDNIADLPAALVLFSEIGVDYLAIKPYSPHPRMKKHMEVAYSPAHMEELDETVERFKDSHSRMNVVFRRNAFATALAGKVDFQHCYALPFWGYISSSGDFYTCSVHLGDPDFRVGNIYTETYRDIVFGQQRARSIEYGRYVLQADRICRQNCRMAQINKTLRILAKPPDHVNFI